MAMTVLSGCYKQPQCGDTLSDQGKRGRTFVYKGDYAKLQTMLNSVAVGSLVEYGWVLVSGNLTGYPGETGLLSLECEPDDDDSDEAGGGSEQKPLKETWTIRSVRNDLSILCYCGGSSASDPHRENIEAWMREPDGKLAAENKYTTSDGAVRELNTLEVYIADKIRCGTEAVMRFYPIITKKTVWAKPPPRVFEGLSTKCVPVVGGAPTDDDEESSESGEEGKTRYKMPGNIDQIIAEHDWLKCQDDTDEDPGGTWTRTESWMGTCKEDSGSWDINLYGESNGHDTLAGRWPIPMVQE